MRKFDLLTFYDLRECLGIWEGTGADTYSGVSALKVRMGDTFTEQIERIAGADAETQTDPVFSALPFYSWKSTAVPPCWVLDQKIVAVLNLLSLRYGDNWSGWGEDETTAARDGWDRIFAKLLSTWDRFNSLLSVYDDVTGHLLDPVRTETTNVAKAKDTPQSEIDPFSNSYNAAVTTNEGTAETDMTTKAERVKEIWEKYRNILSDWADDIGSVLLDRANI